jgi:hypothetical protein
MTLTRDLFTAWTLQGSSRFTSELWLHPTTNIFTTCCFLGTHLRLK